MAIAGFSIQDKSGRARFFEETFLSADTSMEVVLRISFLALSNVNIQFDTISFTWRTYGTGKALPITRRVELINKHNFAKVALDENSETFIVYIAALGVPGATKVAGMPIHLNWANQVQVAALKQDKALTEISPE